MTDAELHQLIREHRARWGYDLHKLARRGRVGGVMVDHYYVVLTIAKARARDDRAQRIQALHDLGRQAA